MELIETDPYKRKCELVLGLHLNTNKGKIYRDGFCINVCHEYGIEIPDVQKYCTLLKKQGRLRRKVDENKRVFYIEV